MLSNASDASPLCTRLEQAVTSLRRRLEQHLDQESQSQRMLRDWQSRCSEQCLVLSHTMAMLEAHLSAWTQSPRFNVIAPE